MKNIADVNSDDILTELNNIGYEEEDLKLLDDEDIRPINNKPNDDLSDFYLDYDGDNNKPKVDLFNEKINVPPSNDRPFDKYVESNKVQKIEDIKPQPKVEEKVATSVDAYLNRPQQAEKVIPSVVSEPKPVRPLYNDNQSKTVSNVVQPVVPKSELYNKDTTNNNQATDLNQLFNKVTNNVKGASELVSKNAEIKRKIDERFAELKKLQQEHELTKQKDLQEINAYKEDVYNKIQVKKQELEKDYKELRTEQEKLEKERKEFEVYKSSAMANLNKLEKDLKTSYETRNKNIEQVELGLVKRKEQLDKERTAIAKEREELANNLVKFNKLVSDFTQDMDNFE